VSAAAGALSGSSRLKHPEVDFEVSGGQRGRGIAVMV